MPALIVHPSGPLRGAINIPGDKSITHRAIMLASLAHGTTLVRGWVPAEVCRATLRCMLALGASIEEAVAPDGTALLRIEGAGPEALHEPEDVLHCAGSGTTMRLLAGLLAGLPFTSVLTGTEPLRRRPMGRIADPLRRMGATVLGRDGGRLPPLTIRGGGLHGIAYTLPVASAQVKSAILLAGLLAEGETEVTEPGPSRDHTERMMRVFGGKVVTDGPRVRLHGGQRLAAPLADGASPGTLAIPGDFSSAAFPLVAAAIVPGSDVHLSGVGTNPTRTGLWDILLRMGLSASLQPVVDSRGDAPDDKCEPIAELSVMGSMLRGTEVAGDLVVRSIDEFPILAVAATQAQGLTVVREAEELRVKESDRIASVAGELRKMGAHVEERPDGMVIQGPTRLQGADVRCHRDHRLAMALAIAGLVAGGVTRIEGAESLNDSFPGFVEAMRGLGAEIAWSPTEPA